MSLLFKKKIRVVIIIIPTLHSIESASTCLNQLLAEGVWKLTKNPTHGLSPYLGINPPNISSFSAPKIHPDHWLTNIVWSWILWLDHKWDPCFWQEKNTSSLPSTPRGTAWDSPSRPAATGGDGVLVVLHNNYLALFENRVLLKCHGLSSLSP